MILKGNIEIESTDVSDQVASLTFMGSRDSVNLRATYGSEPSFAAGNVTYECSIDLNQGVAATDLSIVLFDQLADADGTITVYGTFQPGAVSATNPSFTATALVTDFEVGGEVNTEGTSAFTFPLLARPVKAES